MTSYLREATTSAMREVFDDESMIDHALAFEIALARARAASGLIPVEIADEIDDTCMALNFDPRTLGQEAAHAGTLAIPLVAHLRDALGGAAATEVHAGATSQDLADTVLVLQLLDATDLLRADLDRIGRALAKLAERYAKLPCAGHTLLQPAQPISAGLRFAQWFAGIDNAATRLSVETSTSCKIQLGGPAGTRAGLGGRGADIAAHMAKALGLKPGVPWHARRVGIAAIASAIGIVLGALGKMAGDIALLSALGELEEPALTGCQVALTAAKRAPGLVAAILGGLPQELERGLGGWQAEGPVLAELYLLAAGSAEAMRVAAEVLALREPAIARNVAALGTDIGEAESITHAILDHHKKVQ